MTDRPRPAAGPDEPERVVIRDKRKIDPLTGEVRAVPPAAAEGSAAEAESAGSAGSAGSDEVTALRQAVAERTSDLQRLQAEYANYRKRAERDRLAATDVAIGRVLGELVPVLDDIDRAREHGDLNGALKAVADRLDGIFGKLGLQAFGEVGDPFDPALHEAVMHTESDDVTEPTSTTVMRRGYRHGERLLRPAMVAVTAPAAAAAAAPEPAGAPEGDASAQDVTGPPEQDEPGPGAE